MISGGRSLSCDEFGSVRLNYFNMILDKSILKLLTPIPHLGIGCRIAQTEIHPNSKADDLQIIPEFPLPILVGILGIASVVPHSGRKAMKRLT